VVVVRTSSRRLASRRKPTHGLRDTDTQEGEVKTLSEMLGAYNQACERVQEMVAAVDALDARDDATVEEYAAANDAVGEATEAADAAKRDLDQRQVIERARAGYKPEPVPAGANTDVRVDEPEMYQQGGPQTFLRDVYLRDLRHDPAAAERLARHQLYELQRIEKEAGEKRAVATATLGGAIPPQYLVNLYAKALRNGRVYANQANRSEPLPDTGMSLIIPRFTTGLAAGVQTSESTAVTTQDPVEADLTVNVRTIAGYSPVSRQTLERAQYSEAILMEDLGARYAAGVDSQCISGSGASGQILGVLNTASISTSTVATATVAAVWPKIADLIQQIETAVGGLGINADKIFMHPRRYGFFSAGLDSQNRPLLIPDSGGPFFNAMGDGGDVAAYGYTGTRLQGLPVFTDANIPTNLGGGSNEDRIIVQASQVVHLWERDNDPVTLAFEQQAGTSLQVQLVAFGYVAFTAGRYPAASGVISGAGLIPPTF
jgi:HK97 family phage major capsid protein